MSSIWNGQIIHMMKSFSSINYVLHDAILGVKSNLKP